MREQLNLFSRGQFVVERDEDAATVKDRVGRDQPLRLIGHDDGGAIARRESIFLKSGSERQRGFLELGVGEASFFALAIGLDQASLIGPAVERILQRLAQAGILGEIKHYLN